MAPGREDAAPGQGPQGTGRRWQVWLLPCPGPSIHRPQLLVLAPAGSRVPSHQIPVFLGDGEGHRSSCGDLGSACLRSRCPRLNAAPLWLLFSLGRGGQHRRGHLRPSDFPLITPPSCLSGLALLAQAAGAPPPGSLGRAPAPGVAGRVHLAQSTRRRRRIGSSSSGKRQRGLGVPPPRHPDVPLSPGLPTG